ncbi:UNVERIFIED_CONTAM: hypothetical protein Slati_3420700 [Sesamum latifolium]|uniref:Uncharacterized protein n=1 Tax=Sesamum latifolium TaxID=2727402 RepID=A0AAW2UFF3_9LAMI
MPSYAKFLKEAISNKRKWEGGETVKLNEECSAILQNKLPPKLKDPGSFAIPCTIGNINFDKSLCDLGRSIKYHRKIVEDVLVKVEKFIIPVDFIVLDMEEDKNMPLILERHFLAMSRTLIDVQKDQLTLRVNDEHIVLNVFKPLKYLHKNDHDIFAIDSINTLGTNNAHLAKYSVAFNGSTYNQKVKPPVEALPNCKKVSKNKGRHPNRIKKRRNQAHENAEMYKERTKAWFHNQNAK